MAELDYAFLADYAAVQAGKLTVIGASFTHVTLSSIPASIPLHVAGRIRAAEGERDIKLGIRVEAPGDGLKIEFDGTVNPGPDVLPYDGKVGLLFALNIQLPVQSEGLYQVFVSVGDKTRRLAFEAKGS